MAVDYDKASYDLKRQFGTVKGSWDRTDRKKFEAGWDAIFGNKEKNDGRRHPDKDK